MIIYSAESESEIELELSTSQAADIGASLLSYADVQESCAEYVNAVTEARAKAHCLAQLKADGDAEHFGGDAAIVSDDGTPPMSFQAFLAASAAKGQTHVVLVFGDGDTTDKSYDKFDELSALADRVALVYVPWSLYSDECSHDPFLSRFGHIFAEAAVGRCARSLNLLFANPTTSYHILTCGESPQVTENPAAFLHELTVVSPMGVELGAGGAQWVIAEYDCSAEADDELSFQIGDKIKITRQDDSDWWEGECHGKTGAFPMNYVRKATPQEL